MTPPPPDETAIRLKAPILVADGERRVQELFTVFLRDCVDSIETAGDVESAGQAMSRSDARVVFVDYSLPGGGGTQLLCNFAKKPVTERPLVVLMGSGAGHEVLLDALRLRAFDFLAKPFGADDLRAVLERAAEELGRVESARGPSASRRPGRRGAGRPRRIIGDSPKVRELNRLIEKVAPSGSTVLIRGESGTGKELVASALHALSPRGSGPQVPVNCGAIPEDLLESELFGHVKGSFTGAIATRPGRFVLADGGTVFLDEVGDMSPKLQVKVLRVLQEQELEPVGSTETIRVDVRILAATNVDLERAVEEKRFREDLYYRLNVIPIEVPPLRERIGDLPLLIRHFIGRFNHVQPRQLEGFSDEAMELLRRFPWPGNVRELENLVERMSVLAAGAVVQVDDLPEKIRNPAARRSASAVATAPSPPRLVEPPAPAPAASETPSPFVGGAAPTPVSEGVNPEERLFLKPIIRDDEDETAPHGPSTQDGLSMAPGLPTLRDVCEKGLTESIEDIERRLILQALEECDGVKSRAAELLNIKRTTLVEKMKKRDIVYAGKSRT